MNLFHLIDYYKIRKSCKIHEKKLIFDMSDVDNSICVLADKIYSENKDKFKKFNNFTSKVGYMASELYDLGGHTPCLVNIAEALFENKKLPLFITRLNSTNKKAPKTMKKLDACCKTDGVDFKSYKFINSLISLYNKIIDNPPNVMLLYIHQHDILATAVIHLLKKTTDMKFAFFDHATHFPNLAMTLCDIILELLPMTQKVTNKKRHLQNCTIVGLQSKKKEEVKYYSKDKINQKKTELGIKNGELLTVSGGSSYKYFEENKSSHYEMIKNLLQKMPNLKHLAITNLTCEQKKVIDEIFKNNPNEKKRLIFHNLTPEYELLFQCADLFIDSFPVSSAMTQIDLMGMKVPTVVKINTENPTWTFHEYMPQNYPYMYEKVEDMENGISYLLSNKEERESIIQSNYEFWLKTYESDVVKEKYLKIIDNLLSIGDKH